MSRLSAKWIAGVMTLAVAARVAAVSWDGGGGDSYWTNALNWSGNTLPAAGSAIYITNAVTVNGVGLAGGNLPLGATLYISGGATLTMSSGAIRMNGCTLNVAGNGALSGAFWDMNNATLNFQDGASVNINDWENKGTNTFKFTPSMSSFTKLNASNFRIGNGSIPGSITNATYTVDLINYFGGTNPIVLVDYNNNVPGVTAASFKGATRNITNAFGVYTNAHVEFDDVANNIVLSFDQPPPVPTTIKTPGLTITFDTSGYASSLTNSSGVELLNGQLSDGFYLLGTNNVKRRFDQIANLGGGAYRFTIGGSTEQFTAQFGGTNDYLTVRFVSITNVATTERLFFGLNILNSGLRALPLDWMVVELNVASLVRLERLSLWELSTSNAMGGFAVYQYISPTREDDTLLDLWTMEGLPHPKVAGSWNRAAAEAWLTNWINMAYDMSYLNIVPDTLAEHYTYLPYADAMDAKGIYLWNLIWRGEYWLLYRQNDEINSTMYPSGMADLQSFKATLAANGDALMLHYLSGNIGEVDPEFTAASVSPDLQSWGTVTLAGAIASNTTSFVVQPAAGVKLPVVSSNASPTEPPPVIPSFFDFKTFRLGSEWLSASSVTDLGNGTWQLNGVTRGRYNTVSQGYSAGTSLRGYLRPYNQDFVPDPNSALLTTIATRWANLNNTLGSKNAEFDGFEIHTATGQWGKEKFAARVYEKLDHPTTSNTSSGVPPDAWLEYRFNRVKDALGGSFQTRQHASLFLGDRSRITPGREELENEMNKFFNVNNRGFSLGSYDVKGVSISTLTNYGLTGETLTLLRDWKDASLATSASARTAMDVFRAFDPARGQLNGNHKWATALWRVDGASLRKWFALGTDIYTREWHFGQEHGSITPRLYLKNGATQTLEVPTELNSGAQQTRIIGRVLPRFNTNSGANVNLMTYLGGSSLAVKGTNNTGAAVWNDTALPVYPTPSLDLRTKRGLGLWVTGDNSGATLVIRLRRNSQSRDYVVPVNFSGARWIEIPTGEQGWRVKNWGWAIATRQTMDYQFVNSIAIGLGHLPANTTSSVTVQGLTALAETAEALVNPTITLGAESRTVTGSIATENHFILEPDGTFTVYDSLWHAVFTQKFSSGLQPASLSTFSIQSASSTNIWLEVGVQASNETVANPAYTSRGTAKRWLDDFGLVMGGNYEAADVLDADLDGLFNWQEFQAGTNPTNAASRLVINSIAPIGSGQYAVAWQSVPGKTYNLLSATNLGSPVWITNVAGIAGAGSQTTSTGVVSTASGFLRIELAK